MIDHFSIQVALRTRALTLAVVSTGSASLSATATGYARAAGSFVTDGLAAGMEVTPSGFASNPVSTITDVQPLTITVADARTVEGAAGSRTLAVGLPLARTWENKKPAADPPVQGKPYVVEQYLPGAPPKQITLGAFGDLELQPMYALRIHVPADKGFEAASRYADAIARLFTPRTAIAVGSDVLRVRSDSGPYRGQLLQSSPGFAVVPITIPCWIRTPNSI